MAQISVQVESVSGERSEEIKKFSSSDIQLSTDLNVLELQSNDDGSLNAPFIMEIKYNPPVGRITLKGKAIINGDENELRKIKEKNQNNETPPEELVRKIIKQNLVEAAILSKTLDIPSPIPLPQSLKKNSKN